MVREPPSRRRQSEQPDGWSFALPVCVQRDSVAKQLFELTPAEERGSKAAGKKQMAKLSKEKKKKHKKSHSPSTTAGNDSDADEDCLYDAEMNADA